MMLGITSSLVLGAPLGTAIGAVADWRATLWFVTALGLLAAALIRLWLPPLPGTLGTLGLRQRLAPLGDRQVL
ncbi:MAG TPA: MFS transporter, partial [Pseudonocardia sp.]|nr:MFS transporter [Pseudonocardia sp.]